MYEENSAPDAWALSCNPEASLVVLDFTISVYDSSWKYFFFGLILSSFLSLFKYFESSRPSLGFILNRKRTQVSKWEAEQGIITWTAIHRNCKIWYCFTLFWAHILSPNIQKSLLANSNLQIDFKWVSFVLGGGGGGVVGGGWGRNGLRGCVGEWVMQNL